MRFRTPANLIFLLLVFMTSIVAGQTNPHPPPVHIESTQKFNARLAPPQKQQFDEAGRAFDSQHYAEALSICKLLLKDLPGNLALSKLASESALNTGDVSFALNSLKPIVQASPNDWQATALLARAYAESGDKTDRDAEIAHMLDLHKRGVTPPGMQQYIVERVNTGDKSLLIFTSLEPWGHYHVYYYAQIFDASGHLWLSLTIESSESDQAIFARAHPTEAAAGLRSFSLNGYLDSDTNSKGQRTQTHYIFEFFTGQPTYGTIRNAFIRIAAGRMRWMTSRVNVLQ